MRRHYSRRINEANQSPERSQETTRGQTNRSSCPWIKAALRHSDRSLYLKKSGNTIRDTDSTTSRLVGLMVATTRDHGGRRPDMSAWFMVSLHDMPQTICLPVSYTYSVPLVPATAFKSLLSSPALWRSALIKATPHLSLILCEYRYSKEPRCVGPLPPHSSPLLLSE